MRVVSIVSSAGRALRAAQLATAQPFVFERKTLQRKPSRFFPNHAE